VVGAGFGGLSAAWHFRKMAGPDARILVLDNHDDFGGHAKRNEFDVDGTQLLSYGGTYYMVGAANGWPREIHPLLDELGVKPQRFENYYDGGFQKKHSVQHGIFFDAEHYGVDSLLSDPLQMDVLGPERTAGGDPPNRAQMEQAVAKYPISDEAKAKLIELAISKDPVYPGLTIEEKTKRVKTTSYEDFLRDEREMPEEVLGLLRNSLSEMEGIGADGMSIFHASFYKPPGLRTIEPEVYGADNYIGDAFEKDLTHHFPDGNASLARMMVRHMVPGSAPGETMEDIMDARFDYDKLDREENSVRIRLESTAVDVRHAEGGKSVDVTYVQGGKAFRVRGKHTIVACWGNVIPHICPEMGDVQKKALEYPDKWPLVYANVALRDWKPIAQSGFNLVYAPKSFFNLVRTDNVVSMGGYQYSQSPDDPIVLNMHHQPGNFVRSGTARERFRGGRYALLGLSYDDFEKKIVDQLQATWGPWGFDAQKQIAAITVNRWPHGVSYIYNSLYDPLDWNADKGPHTEARKRMNRISFAGADVGGEPLTQRAIQEGLRAVQEQLDLG